MTSTTVSGSDAEASSDCLDLNVLLQQYGIMEDIPQDASNQVVMWAAAAEERQQQEEEELVREAVHEEDEPVAGGSGGFSLHWQAPAQLTGEALAKATADYDSARVKALDEQVDRILCAEEEGEEQSEEDVQVVEPEPVVLLPRLELLLREGRRMRSMHDVNVEKARAAMEKERERLESLFRYNSNALNEMIESAIKERAKLVR
jgi:hypothetical protein